MAQMPASPAAAASCNGVFMSCAQAAQPRGRHDATPQRTRTRRLRVPSRAPRRWRPLAPRARSAAWPDAARSCRRRLPAESCQTAQQRDASCQPVPPRSRRLGSRAARAPHAAARVARRGGLRRAAGAAGSCLPRPRAGRPYVPRSLLGAAARHATARTGGQRTLTSPPASRRPMSSNIASRSPGPGSRAVPPTDAIAVRRRTTRAGPQPARTRPAR